MIKFFRKIRQNLLAEGKTGKYLKYAIGEIVLVVIGILIALQINNWNQGRVLKDKSYSFLKQINKDLSIEIRSYEADIEALSDNSLIFDEVGKSITLDDSLLMKLGSIIHMNYRPTNFGASYRGFIDSGDIDLIEDKQLLNELQVYYSIFLGRLNDMAEYHAAFNLQNIEGRLVERLVFQPDGSYTLESLKKEIKTGNLMSMVNWQKLTYKQLIKMLEQCLELAQIIHQKIDEMEKTKG
jgi:hypothetical protein